MNVQFAIFTENTFEIEEKLLNKITLFNSPINIIDERVHIILLNLSLSYLLIYFQCLGNRRT